MGKLIYNTIIVEDDADWIARLTDLIVAVNEMSKTFEIRIIGKCESRTAAKPLIEAQKPDLLFLDIEAPNPGDGFGLLEDLKTIDFHVIFVTAYSISSYITRYGDINQKLGTSPMSWIDKSEIGTSSLMKAMEKLKSITDEYGDDLPEANNIISQNLQKPFLDQDINIYGPRSYNQIRIGELSPSGGYKKLLKIKVGDIIYIRGGSSGDALKFGQSSSTTNDNIMYYLDNKKKFRKIFIRKTLKKIHTALDGREFCFVNKSYIVNIGHIRQYEPEFGWISVETEIGKIEQISVGDKMKGFVEKLFREG